MKKLFLVTTMILLCTFIFAQTTKKEPFNKWEIGVNGGVSNFSGEYNSKLHSTYDWDSQGSFGFGATLKKNFTHVFALELGWNQNTLLPGTVYHGFELAYVQPTYRTLTNEYDLNTVWNMNNLLSRNKFDRKLYVYTKLGVGGVNVNNKIGDITGITFVAAIPVGAGVAIKLTEKVKLNVGTQWTWTNTDRLDGHTTQNAENIYGTKVYTYAGLSFALGKNKKIPLPEIVPVLEPRPEPKPEPQSVKIVEKVKPTVIGNTHKVYFAFDKWNLTPASFASLDSLAKDLTENPTVNVSITSHTDSRGPASYNMKLSEKRGKSVIDYLSLKGIQLTRIDAKSYGETK